MKLDEEMKARTAICEEAIRFYLPQDDGYLSEITEAMNYSVLAGGKRLRPMLMLETYRMFGGKEEKLVWPFMAAIEMIHTYSLVHDDLPAMDNDAYRRGRKTTHTVYGEAMGILAGDGLLNYAYETAMKTFSLLDQMEQAAGEVKQKERLWAIRALAVLTEKPGVFGMLGGQAVDVASEGEIISLDKLLFIHKKKTAALVEASMMIGALLAGAGEDKVHRLEESGTCVGLAFQIRDDILDVNGTEEEMGKPLHSDERNQKCTYVSCTGMEEACAEVERYSQRAIALLEETGKVPPFLKELLLWLIHRNH